MGCTLSTLATRPLNLTRAGRGSELPSWSPAATVARSQWQKRRRKCLYGYLHKHISPGCDSTLGILLPSYSIDVSLCGKVPALELDLSNSLSMAMATGIAACVIAARSTSNLFNFSACSTSLQENFRTESTTALALDSTKQTGIPMPHLLPVQQPVHWPGIA